MGIHCVAVASASDLHVVTTHTTGDARSRSRRGGAPAGPKASELANFLLGVAGAGLEVGPQVDPRALAAFREDRPCYGAVTGLTLR
jgi:hypothetical protein